VTAPIINIAERKYKDLAQQFWDTVEDYMAAGCTQDESIQSAGMVISCTLEKQGIPVQDFNLAARAEAKRRGYDK